MFTQHRQNQRLKKIVADQALDIDMLKELNRGAPIDVSGEFGEDFAGVVALLAPDDSGHGEAFGGAAGGVGAGAGGYSAGER